MAQYLINIATNCHFRPTCRAVWHETVSTTPESTFIQIKSDIVAFTYDFIMTGDYQKLLQALHNAKLSKYNFKRCLAGDEETYSEKYQAYLKLFFNFFEDKSQIELKCSVHEASRERKFFIKSSQPFNIELPKKYLELWRNLCKIEEAYGKL